MAAKLICTAFHGPAPCETLDVIYKNNNKHDIRMENLEWGISDAKTNRCSPVEQYDDDGKFVQKFDTLQ